MQPTELSQNIVAIPSGDAFRVPRSEQQVAVQSAAPYKTRRTNLWHTEDFRLICYSCGIPSRISRFCRGVACQKWVTPEQIGRVLLYPPPPMCRDDRFYLRNISLPYMQDYRHDSDYLKHNDIVPFHREQEGH